MLNIILFISLLIYLELNPSHGNIWLRPDENNNYVLNLLNHSKIHYF